MKIFLLRLKFILQNYTMHLYTEMTAGAVIHWDLLTVMKIIYKVDIMTHWAVLEQQNRLVGLESRQFTVNENLTKSNDKHTCNINKRTWSMWAEPTCSVEHDLRLQNFFQCFPLSTQFLLELCHSSSEQLQNLFSGRSQPLLHKSSQSLDFRHVYRTRPGWAARSDCVR